jgi:hypothetical protein
MYNTDNEHITKDYPDLRRDIDFPLNGMSIKNCWFVFKSLQQTRGQGKPKFKIKILWVIFSFVHKNNGLWVLNIYNHSVIYEGRNMHVN